MPRTSSVLQPFEDIEARIIGCLIEKSIVTPDQYPLTLNGLTNACNQKSARNPVMALQQGEVQHALRILEAKHLVQMEENFKSRTEKYLQRFCNTRYSDLQFDSAELAIVCLLLLRGPQTPGELRARSGRLHVFADNAEVLAALKRLMVRDGDPLIVELPRTPGRKDSEYMHLFGGPIDLEEYANTARTATPAVSSKHASVAELTERVAQLEADVAELKKMLQ
ncbi:MAG: DUF480 domain-containing protein [Gammaproteobacteria bacterium]|nr:DUF480 domain-containing protein [Gammaproteobacteria bacterium]MBT8109148.1 DUF480 domain-containing protein [Gammaproteobacteria bacterium]